MSNTAVHVRQILPAQSVPPPQKATTQKLPFMEWNTPGTHLTRALRKLAEVSFVGERFDVDTNALLIVLTSDPEPVLDQVYAAEQALYKIFPKAKFSLRVKTDPTGGNRETLFSQYFVRWAKPGPADAR